MSQGSIRSAPERAISVGDEFFLFAGEEDDETSGVEILSVDTRGVTQEFHCQTADRSTYMVCIDGYGFNIYRQDRQEKWQPLASYENSAIFRTAAQYLQDLHNGSVAE